MNWLKWTLVIIGAVYLLTAVSIAIFTMFLGANFATALVVGFLIPFKWMRLI